MARRVLSVIIGVLLFMGLTVLTESIMGRFYHLPVGIDINNKEVLAKAMAAMPAAAFFMLLAGYMVAAFTGGAIATLVAGRINHDAALIVGGIATLGGLGNVMTIPHPWWFTILNILSYVPAAYIGYVVVRKRGPQI